MTDETITAADIAAALRAAALKRAKTANVSQIAINGRSQQFTDPGRILDMLRDAAEIERVEDSGSFSSVKVRIKRVR